MVDHDEDATAASRFGWFSAGAVTAVVALAVLLFGGNLFSGGRMVADTPQVIIEAP
jgi:hypothetical protein